MAKIRRDSHSLYVRTNGSVFRPWETPYSYETSQGATQGVTQFAEGEEVKLGHVNHTPFARLRGDDTGDWSNRVELWHSHGDYYDYENNRTIPSDQVWDPK